MNVEPDVSKIAALIGDKSRANMLNALMDGRALTAIELAIVAGVTPQTASSHLNKLLAVQLVSQEKQGRHRYFRLASPKVAHALEALMLISPNDCLPKKPLSKHDEAMRFARTCYDHLAGTLGVSICTFFLSRGFLLPKGGDLILTDKGENFFLELGIDMEKTRKQRRCFARKCVDWSERKPHLAGALGAEFTNFCFESNWIYRPDDSRSVSVTAKGMRDFRSVFGLKF